jgi:hypothetical protein
MTNTVLVEGKGITVGFEFYRQELKYKDRARTFARPFRWWQIKPRYSLRIQNVDHSELRDLTSFVHKLSERTKQNINLEIF